MATNAVFGAPLLEVAGLSKTFPTQRALTDFNLVLHAGEVHALVGQNGCGKSTVMKLLTGYHQPDDGVVIRARGAGSDLHGLRDSLPVRAVHQDLGVIGALTASDNLGLGRAYQRHRFGLVNWSAQRREYRRMLDAVGGADVDLDLPLAAAPPVHRALVALARAISDWGEEGGLLILDELTGALSEDEVARLVEVLRRLCERGVAVLMVSHRLSEVIEIAERVTVLREGHVVAQRETAGLDEAELVRLMLSAEGASQLAEVEAATHTHQEAPHTAEITVSVRGLRAPNVEGLDLDLCAGEVVGFAGLVGAGHIDAAYLLAGGLPAYAGTVRIGATTLRATSLTPQEAKRAGVGFVPGDRDAEGLFAQLPLSANVTIPRLRSFRRWGLLDSGAERVAAEGVVDLMQIRPADAAAKVGSLSGGNRQKVLLGRGLGIAREVFVIAEPTVGVDIAAKMNIFHHIRSAADGGLPTVVASTDAADLEALCDRVLVFADGRVIEVLRGDDVTEGRIYQAIARTHRKVSTEASTEGHAS